MAFGLVWILLFFSFLTIFYFDSNDLIPYKFWMHERRCDHENLIYTHTFTHTEGEKNKGACRRSIAFALFRSGYSIVYGIYS